VRKGPKHAALQDFLGLSPMLTSQRLPRGVAVPQWASRLRRTDAHVAPGGQTLLFGKKSACRARAATRALVLIGLVLALSACTASAASVSFAPAFSNNLLGEGGSFTAPFTFSGTEYFGAVDPITEVTVHLPAGIGGDSSGFAVCPMATLQLNGLMGCPPGSLAGPVTPGGLEDDIIDKTPGSTQPPTLVTEAVTSQAVYTDSGLVFYVEGHSPVSIEFMLPAHEVPDAPPYGRALVVSIPTLPSIPEQPNISFTSLDLAVGAAAQSGGSTAHNVVIPSQCASGFAWAGDVRFEDGTTSRVTTATGCPGAATPPPPPAISPKNTGLPTISGSARVWQTLSCVQGSWTGNLPLTFTYQWRRDGAGISGATGSTYVVEEADAGHSLTCEVTATNIAGRTSATSTAVSVPARRPPSGSSCPDVVIFGARGSGEDNTASNVGMGPVPYQVAQEIRNRLPLGFRVEMIGVNYLAVGPLGAVANGSDYLNSVSTGAEVLVNGYNGQVGLVSTVLSCPKVAVVLVGLSQGSHVIHYAMSLAPTQPSTVTRRIAAILLFGDPVRQPHQSYNIGNQDASGVLSNLGPLPGNTGPPSIASYLEPATQSYCLPKDPICDYTGIGDLAKNRGIHDGYGSSPYIAAAALFAVRHIRAAAAARTATAAVTTGVPSIVARASRAHRSHPSHKCVSHQTGLYEAISACPHVTHGVRPQRQSTYKGSSRDRDRITMTASRNATNVSVKVVDRCGTVFSGTIGVTRAGIFDGTTPEGFEITGLFANKRIVRGTLTDPSCKSLPIRSFTLRRRGH
jgi:Cutinase